MLADRIIRIFTSLWLTIFCLGFAILLIFLGTLAQVKLGLYEAQRQYFQSFLVFWSPENSDLRIPILPGGYLVGGVLFFNLVAAHIKRFTLTRKKIGIFMVHGGVILLLVGQFITDLFQVESAMRLVEGGEAKNYSESQRHCELVLINGADPEVDQVVAVPESKLKEGALLSHPDLPFQLRVKQFLPHSTLAFREGEKGQPASTEGSGKKIVAEKRPIVTDGKFRNMPSAVVEVVEGSQSRGTWLASLWLENPQIIESNGKSFGLAVRPARFYKPYSIALLDFTHERYKGTEKPKNFSSKVRLHHFQTQESRETLIYMNNPLRYGGETYFQGGFDDKDASGKPVSPDQQKVSILQVVRNPGWLTPYFSVGLVGLGLLVQFLTHLIAFVKKRRPA